MKILAGLGNPGKEYQSTRHNVGFMLLDQINEVKKLGKWKLKKDMQCEILEWSVDEERVLMVKPVTFMNNSGWSISKIVAFYQVKIGDLLVVHDDMDLDFGDIRIKKGGGTAGHHGLDSILNSLGGQDDFLRLRVGIGKRGENVLSPQKGGSYVVGKFRQIEIKKLPAIFQRATEAIECCLVGDLEKCMTEYNKKISDNLLMERN